ncbi:MAG: helix-turn-helix transcriptional regulator [Sulfuricurvum sp.]
MYSSSSHLSSLQKCNQEKHLELFYKQIGKNVKEIRLKNGLSQLQLANAMGYDSVGHIAKAELHKYGKRFNLEHIFKIAQILEVPILEIFAGTDEIVALARECEE